MVSLNENFNEMTFFLIRTQPWRVLFNSLKRILFNDIFRLKAQRYDIFFILDPYHVRSHSNRRNEFSPMVSSDQKIDIYLCGQFLRWLDTRGWIPLCRRQKGRGTQKLVNARQEVVSGGASRGKIEEHLQFRELEV